jgi:hypothetical protein
VRQRVLAFAADAGIPVASTHQNFARYGALIAMGPSIPALAAAAAGYVFVKAVPQGSYPFSSSVSLFDPKAPFPRPDHAMDCRRRAQERSGLAALAATGRLGLDGCEHDGTLRCVGMTIGGGAPLIAHE